MIVYVDIDGVLIDSETTVIKTYQKVLMELTGNVSSYQTIKELVWGETFDEIKKHVEKGWNIVPTVLDYHINKAFRNEKWEILSKGVDLVEMLDQPFNEVRLVTSGRRPNAENKVGCLPDRFENYPLTCSAAKDEKYWKIIRTREGSCGLVVDDSAKIIEAASSQGFGVLHFKV